jgi:hypothetical protein
MLAGVFPATVCRSEKIMPPSDYHDKEASCARRICRSISRIDADFKGEKDRTDLSEYFGALKDSPLLDVIEADAKRVRETAKLRS